MLTYKPFVTLRQMLGHVLKKTSSLWCFGGGVRALGGCTDNLATWNRSLSLFFFAASLALGRNVNRPPSLIAAKVFAA